MTLRTQAVLLMLVSLITIRTGAQTLSPTAKQSSSSLRFVSQMIERKVNAERLRGQFPGAQVGFAYVDGETPDGKPNVVSGSIAVGLADLKSSVPLKTSNRFLAGSIGKTFVAALTMLLVQEGKLTLDDKIEKYLGSEPWFAKLPNGRDVTVRMLLNHSSGIENHVEVESFQKQLSKSASRNITYDELIAYVLNKKPLFQAGTGFKYSDTNYILAGMIIERITGKPFYDLVAERILKPLKLDRTIPSNSFTIPEVATGYAQQKPVIVDGKFTFNPQWEWAGGGFASTAEDLARWANALYGGDVLSAKSLEEMFSSTSTGEGSTYGLGAMVTRSKWGKAYGHDGEFPGYLSDMRYYPKYKIAVAVLVNSDETFGVSRFLSSASDDIAGIIIGATGQRVSQADQQNFHNMTEKWLGLLFAQKFDESWEELTERLQTRFPKEQWASTMTKFSDKAGKFNYRKLRYIAYQGTDRPCVVEFESSFSKSLNAIETVTWEWERGAWRVSGYSLR